MEILQQIPQYGFWFLVVLTVLVFIHELGHFLVARACGVRVEVFSIGFGPELFGWTDRTGTRWKFSWLPLGGYVRMFGQEDNVLEGESARPMTPAERAVSFRHKNVGQRMAIAAAGPVANYVFAILVFAVLYASAGKLAIPPEIGGVIANSPASEAGIVTGDKIVKVQGQAVDDFSDITYAVQSNLGNLLTLEIDRGGQPVTVQLQPREIHDKDAQGKDVSFVGLGMRSTGQSAIKHLSVVDLVRVGECRCLQGDGRNAERPLADGRRRAVERGGRRRPQDRQDVRRRGAVRVHLVHRLCRGTVGQSRADQSLPGPAARRRASGLLRD